MFNPIIGTGKGSYQFNCRLNNSYSIGSLNNSLLEFPWFGSLSAAFKAFICILTHGTNKGYVFEPIFLFIFNNVPEVNNRNY